MGYRCNRHKKSPPCLQTSESIAGSPCLLMPRVPRHCSTQTANTHSAKAGNAFTRKDDPHQHYMLTRGCRTLYIHMPAYTT